MSRVSWGVAFGFLIFLLFGHSEGRGPEESHGASVHFTYGHQEGYQDALEGIRSRCQSKQDCPSQDSYKRDYKLGYKKGIRELKNQGVRPLIDSPGKTIGSDFNGDGIHDLIVGANQNDDGAAVGLDTGGAYIIYGAATLSGTKNTSGSGEDVSIFGKAGGDYLGNSVSSAGDVNGDGMDDIIVGARNQDDGTGSNGGAAYIVFGATSLSATLDFGALQSPDVTILGKADSDSLGESVSAAGDVNGDGFDDIIMGADEVNNGLTADVGAAYIFLGAGNLSGTKDIGTLQSPDVTILGRAEYDRLGDKVSGAGDINGDGFDDIIVGAQSNDGGASGAGVAYIFFGASNLSGTKNLGGLQSADVTVVGKAASDYLGGGISGGGDINGDGFDDLVVGAPGNLLADTKGNVYIFFGASNLSGTKNLGGVQSADVTFVGRSASSKFGHGVSAAGDVNDDGFDDIIVGSYQNDDGGTDRGSTHIFFGASDLSGTKDISAVQSADVTILGRANSDYMGVSVSGIGDVNGDGIPDVQTGAHLNDIGGTNAGAAYVIFGATTLSGTKNLGGIQSADVTLVGQAGDTGDRLGISVGGGRSNPGP